MSGLQYFTYPGYGEKSLEDLHYSQAVRIGDRIECSGQGGHRLHVPPGFRCRRASLGR